MQNLLGLIQTIAQRVGLPSPSTVIGNADRNVSLLLGKMAEAGHKLRDEHDWPEIQKEFTFSLVDGQAAYQLPDDFNSQIFQTLWNRTSQWPLLGPISPEQWQQYKSGIPLLGIYERYRVKGWDTKQLFIDPIPDSSHNGDTCVLEYVSKTWIRPANAWAASTAYTAGQYVYHEGNVYKCTTNGTSSTTGPSHKIGTASDNTTAWLFQAYEYFAADTDVPILSQDLLIDETIWRWKEETGFAYELLKSESEEAILKATTDLKGAGPAYWGNVRRSTPLLGPQNVREGSW